MSVPITVKSHDSAVPEFCPVIILISNWNSGIQHDYNQLILRVHLFPRFLNHLP